MAINMAFVFLQMSEHVNHKLKFLCVLSETKKKMSEELPGLCALWDRIEKNVRLHKKQTFTYSIESFIQYAIS